VHEATRYPRPFGKYLLLRQLAIGGMAEVYLARQSGPAGFEKECVIKRILPSLAADQQFVNMFLDEARIAARLSHPNIVQIFDLGSIGEGDYFLAMEYIHGVDLQQIEEAEQKRGGHVPLPIAVRVASHVAEGLEHAHRATDSRGQPLGLVHRDVTPSNVIVSFDGVAKILDFGIAKAVAQKSSKRTEIGVIKGKIPYMSPEQVQGEALDARSDIFSLGTMLYEMATGKKPFDGEGPADLSMKILNLEPMAPRALIPDFPPQLAQIIQRAMAKRSIDRWPSARELHEALDDFLVQSTIRCTSHDIASYLDKLFPGLREQARAEAATSLPVEVTDPTVPMMNMHKSDPSVRREQPSLMMGEMPVADGMDEQRRMGGGGRGSGSTVVVVLLVLAVAAIFYLATSRSGGGAATSTPAAAQKPADKPATPTVTPPTTPTAAAPQAANPAHPSELPAPMAPSATPKPVVTQLPTTTPSAIKPEAQAGKPEAQPGAEAGAQPGAKSEAKPESKIDHAKAKPPRPHHDKPVTLPHLPTPPPPDDAP
jgi:serine/threonine-protein kinase